MARDTRHEFTRYLEERRQTMSSQMIAIPEASSGEFALVPEATYLMVLKSMEPAEQNENSPYYDPSKPRVRWIFGIRQVLDGEPDEEGNDPEAFVGEEFHGYTSLNMHTRATMRKWAQGLLGREIEDGERVDSADLVGKAGRCNVVHYEKQTGGIGHKIESIRPYRKAANGAKKAKPAPEPIADDFDEDEEPF